MWDGEESELAQVHNALGFCYFNMEKVGGGCTSCAPHEAWEQRGRGGGEEGRGFTGQERYWLRSDKLDCT